VIDVTLAILAGGEGRRMGRPKAELRVGGKPILAYLLDRFCWEGPTILVTAPGRERPPGAERFGREVVDPTAGEGPLRGVITALDATQTAALVIVSCDMPMIERLQLAWLVERLAGGPATELVMTERPHGVLEPLPLSLHVSARSALVKHFRDGGRSLRSLASVDGARVVPTPPDWPESVWKNLNTPADVAAFLDQPGVS
jgi:molybdopterin-guanine dinucleotide biosynthesis protein A